MTLLPTPEFRKYASYFVDLSPDGSQSVEEVAKFAAQYLSKSEKSKLIPFLELCIQSSYSNEELNRLWIDSGARLAPAHARPWFTSLRRYLSTGSFGAS